MVGAQLSVSIVLRPVRGGLHKQLGKESSTTCLVIFLNDQKCRPL